MGSSESDEKGVLKGCAATGRVVSPPLDELGTLRQPLTDGEREVLEFFLRNLAPEWEIYLHPHLNGMKPDVVLLNPKVGVAVFEIKDWNLESLEYRPASSRGDAFLRVKSRDGRVFPKESPLAQCRRYQKELGNVYLPSLYDQRLAAITAGVTFTRAQEEKVRQLLAPEIAAIPEKARKYRPVAGRESLRNDDLKTVFPDRTFSSSRIMTEELAEEMRTWLREPQHSRDQRRSLPLDSSQRALARDRTDSGYRRIRGPAGSGKSTVLTQRAANLIEEGKEVLIISYNHTLRPYLRDLVSRAGSDPGKATWLGFHEWCSRTMGEAGRSSAYDTVWQQGDSDSESKELLNRRLHKVALETLDALENGPTAADVQRYDAILVDEGQDFLPEWWNVLRMVRRDGGEMLLVADRAQDIYGHADVWTEEVMKGAGFSGPWNDLETSYRMPAYMTTLITDFSRRYQPDRVDVKPVLPSQQELPMLNLRWRQVEPGQEISSVLEELDQIVAGGSYSDVGIMTTTRDETRQVVRALKDRGIESNSTVPEYADEETGKERMMKRYFFLGRETVKVTPIPNLKGWEMSRLVVLLTGDNVSSAYTALSRLSIGDFGSALSVVSSVPLFEAYGRTWPFFRSGGAGEGAERPVHSD